jgi:NAD(P)-dependent dehydrogenase (short-subunit alcohol dehydrogenase family)
MIASHLSGSFYCSREALKVMIPRGRGRIINCGSAVAHASFSSSAAYVAAKLGIVGLTRALAVEAAPYGVLVNCVAPGAIDTPRPGIGRLPKDILDVAVAKTPARRWAHPREVASVALFLASEDASYMVGQVLSPNGGAAMGI